MLEPGFKAIEIDGSLRHSRPVRQRLASAPELHRVLTNQGADDLDDLEERQFILAHADAPCAETHRGLMP
jgi:hypothetical protein